MMTDPGVAWMMDQGRDVTTAKKPTTGEAKLVLNLRVAETEMAADPHPAEETDHPGVLKTRAGALTTRALGGAPATPDVMVPTAASVGWSVEVRHLAMAAVSAEVVSDVMAKVAAAEAGAIVHAAAETERNAVRPGGTIGAVEMTGAAAAAEATTPATGAVTDPRLPGETTGVLRHLPRRKAEAAMTTNGKLSASVKNAIVIIRIPLLPKSISLLQLLIFNGCHRMFASLQFCTFHGYKWSNFPH